MTEASMEAIFVLTSLPDKDSAEELARKLVEEKLAACVTVLGQGVSYYRWEGKLEKAGEHPLLVKTVQKNYRRVETFIRMNHPYELPEIVSVPITGGLPEYLDWIGGEVATDNP